MTWLGSLFSNSEGLAIFSVYLTHNAMVTIGSWYKQSKVSLRGTSIIPSCQFSQKFAFGSIRLLLLLLGKEKNQIRYENRLLSKAHNPMGRVAQSIPNSKSAFKINFSLAYWSTLVKWILQNLKFGTERGLRSSKSKVLAI